MPGRGCEKIVKPSCRALLAFVVLGSLLGPLSVRADGEWPSFRGPGARGVGEGYPTRVTWDVESGRGILWKTPIPGLGHSCPSIWGDRLFVTTAVAREGEAEVRTGYFGDGRSAADNGVQSWRLFCLDKGSGEVLWQRTAHEGVPKVKRHTKSSHANPTPATDGERVVAFFGSEGLYVYDMDGKLLWSKDFGVLLSAAFDFPAAEWGIGASPVLHDGRVIVQCDVVGDSFLAVFDARDGREIWRRRRDDHPTWSTPTVMPTADQGKLQIVVNGYRQIGGYDYETGRELWHLTGGGDIPIPTPFLAHDLVFIANAHGREAPVYAVRLSARGDVTPKDGATSGEYLAWSLPRAASYMNTPLVYGEELYVCRDHGGLLSCYDAKTGEEHYHERLSPNDVFVASAVAADGKVYFTSEQGEVHVLKAGKSFERLATNPLGEPTLATPAISQGVLYFRTRHHVVAVGGAEEAP